MRVWQFIHDKKADSKRVVLLYVLESSGSSPGRQGFHMAVAGDGQLCGTIGGGIMEHKFIEMAKSLLKEEQGFSSIHRQVHDKTSNNNQSGMICSGEQTIFIYEVQENDLDHVGLLIHSLQQYQQGKLRLSHNGIYFENAIPETDYYFEKKGDDFILLEKTGLKNKLFIIGGGHCSLALSRLMHTLDFYIAVYDERPGLNTLDQNTFAHEKHVLTSYHHLGSLLEEGNHVYVVIMTFGYRTDDIAFRALLGKSFRYLGMLGSKKKVEKMFKEYSNEQRSISGNNKIHAPVGMQIKSQTADEIAVSIAAEIIAVKNRGQ